MKFDADSILEFWFAGSRESEDEFTSRMEVWFMNSDSFDLEVQQKFEPAIEIAASGSVSDLEEDARGILALIIALDQFPRNIYRGTPRAFAYDQEALRLTMKAIDSGLADSLLYVENLFVYMPLQHSEDLEIQEFSVKTFASLKDSANSEVQMQSAVDSLEYSELHRDIIRDFGRFPHRNEILGRESTQAEIDFLASGAETFGQVKK